MNFETIILVVGGMVIAVILGMGMVIFGPRLTSRSRLKKRILNLADTEIKSTVSGKLQRSGGSRKKNIQARIKEAEDNKAKTESRIVQYRRDLKKAGFKISLQKFFVICIVLFCISLLGYLVSGYAKIGALPFAIMMGFGLPYFIVKRAGKRRENRFTHIFADAVDVIVRGIRSGLPVGECLNIIARESPAPVNMIFQEIVETTKLGVPLDQALFRAEEQMPTAELKFFNIVLAIQSQTGGNLAETLGNLTKILRDRKKMKDKITALSQEAKSSASIIGSLPILVTLVLWLMSPEYIEILFTETVGQVMVGGGLLWMTTGVLVMRQMINFEI